MNEALLNSLPENLKTNYTRLIMKVETNIDINSVILSNENSILIESFLQETEYKDKFLRHGLTPINRLLLYGASGTGKTYLSKAIANNFNYEMLYIDIASALTTGNAAKSLYEIFELANYIETAVVFLDECDAICWARDDNSNEDSAEIRRANNALFQMLDQLNPKCIFISATNLYENLDPAFIRRFNLKLRFVRPSLDKLDEDIKKSLLPSFELVKDFDDNVKDKLLWHARNYTSLSYYEIKNWVERAEKLSIIKDTNKVKESDIYGFFMQSMRVGLSYDEKNIPYLYLV